MNDPDETVTYRPVLEAGITSLADFVRLLRAVVDDCEHDRISADRGIAAMEVGLAAIGPWLDAQLRRSDAGQASADTLRAKVALDAEYRTITAERTKRPGTIADVRRFLDRLAAFVESIDRETGTA